jgi:hypothetical protein
LTTCTTTSWPDSWQHDLVDVEEAVLLEADVDERGLQAREHVVDAAFVDVANDRARAAPLEIQLGDLVTRARFNRLTSASGASRCRLSRGDRSGRFQQRDAGFAAVDADQYLLLQFFSFVGGAARSDEAHSSGLRARTVDWKCS